MVKKKILIVDDEKDFLVVLEKRLFAAGYDVLTADSGKDAIRIAKEQHPDLIVLDIVMPEVDGPMVAETLKQDVDTKKIPIIFLTCLLTKKEESRLGHQIDGHFFIAKPFDPEEMLKEIKKRLPD
ncbi:MAG: response regulator [Candidatus Omnitrophota bacterium]|jgi:two-component system phosphate regulon response regulator PhoB